MGVKTLVITSISSYVIHQHKRMVETLRNREHNLEHQRVHPLVTKETNHMMRCVDVLCTCVYA